jgi:hypothetical protein
MLSKVILMILVVTFFEVSLSMTFAGALDCGFEPCSGQIKEYKIGICCFSTKQVGSESE